MSVVSSAALHQGLVVPVIRNVETMNFADIEKTINGLGEKVLNKALSEWDECVTVVDIRSTS